MYRKLIPPHSYQKHKDHYYIEERIVVNEEDDFGNVTNVVRSKVRNILNPQEDEVLPDSDEYTLENLLKAGVSLNEVNIGHMLDNTDPASLSLAAENAAYEFINNLNEENNEN